MTELADDLARNLRDRGNEGDLIAAHRVGRLVRLIKFELRSLDLLNRRFLKVQIGKPALLKGNVDLDILDSPRIGCRFRGVKLVGYRVHHAASVSETSVPSKRT